MFPHLLPLCDERGYGRPASFDLSKRCGSAEIQLQCVSRTTSVVDHSGGRSLGLADVSREI